MTPHDDKIYKEFRRLFPDLQLDVLDEADIKNESSKIVNIYIDYILLYLMQHSSSFYIMYTYVQVGRQQTQPLYLFS